MTLLLLCIAFWSLQTSDAQGLSPRLPTTVNMTAIIEVDQPPVKLDMLSVLWEHDGRPLVEYRDQKLIIHEPRASMPFQLFENGNLSLILVNITQNDSGNYTCLINYGNQEEKVQYQLIVEAHRIRLMDINNRKTASSKDNKGPFLQMGGFPQVNARPGEVVTLKCKFNTDPSMELPMLTVRWFKNGAMKWFYNATSSQEGPITAQELNKGNADLYLGPAQEEDSGTYICRIKYGTLERSIKTVLVVRDDSGPAPRSIQGSKQSDDSASTNVSTEKYRLIKIALVCGVVASTYVFVFIIFFFI